MIVKELDVKNLKFNSSVDCLNIKSRLPFLCNAKNEVIFGNYFYRDFTKTAKVVFIESSALFEEGLLQLETALAQENSIDRLYAFDNEIYDYLEEENEIDSEQLSLFDLDEFCENRCITSDLYIYPGEYDFKKAKKKDDEEDDYNLFSFLENEEAIL